MTMRHKVVLTGTRTLSSEDGPYARNDPTTSIRLEVEYDSGTEDTARELMVEMIVQMRYHLGEREADLGAVAGELGS